MNGVLRPQLGPDQLLLLQETFTPYDRMGERPVWAYVDHQLDAKGLVAAEVLGALPIAGGPGGGQMRYGLTRNQDNHWLPNDGTPLELTVAGLWHLGSASAPLLVAFKDTVRFLVERQRSVTPSPTEVVEARVTSQEVARWLAGSGLGGLQSPAVDVILRKVGQLLEHEPYLWRGWPPQSYGANTKSAGVLDKRFEYRRFARKVRPRCQAR